MYQKNKCTTSCQRGLSINHQSLAIKSIKSILSSLFHSWFSCSHLFICYKYRSYSLDRVSDEVNAYLIPFALVISWRVNESTGYASSTWNSSILSTLPTLCRLTWLFDLWIRSLSPCRSKLSPSFVSSCLLSFFLTRFWFRVVFSSIFLLSLHMAHFMQASPFQNP